MKNVFKKESKKQKNYHYYLGYNHFNFLLIIICSAFYYSINDSIYIIHLIVEGEGYKSILNTYFNQKPYAIYINEKKIKDNFNFIILNYNFEPGESNVTIVFDKPLKSCSSMFSNCDSIKQIDLSEFDFSEVNNMAYMFENCRNLENIYFGNINTLSVKNMQGLFYNCIKLISVDVSKFDTSSVTRMDYMFYSCHSLVSIYLSNFNTSKVENMNSMFTNCLRLESLNLSNFETSSVTNMFRMFNFCYRLKYLDISNFNTRNVKSIFRMFYYCQSITYLNLDSFRFNNLTNNSLTFKQISSSTKFCINDEETINLLNLSVISVCSDTCYNETNAKIDIYNNKCIESCFSNGYNYEYKDVCYFVCPEGTHKSKNDSHICVENEKCEDFNINNSKCYENTPEGFYFDENDGFYKICFANCKSCYGPGNETENNCSKCELNFTFLNEQNYKTNCYKN